MWWALAELPTKLIYTLTLPGRTTSCASGAQAANVMTDALALSTFVVVVVVVHVVVDIVSSLLLQVVTVVIVVTFVFGSVKGG
jgi:maltodextrin utilization protein YvdJ